MQFIGPMGAVLEIKDGKPKIGTENTAFRPQDNRHRRIPKPPHGRTHTRQALESMAVGDTKKFYHDDVACQYDEHYSGCCSLISMICVKRKQGWKVEFYHESKGIAVVMRLK